MTTLSIILALLVAGIIAVGYLIVAFTLAVIKRSPSPVRSILRRLLMGLLGACVLVTLYQVYGWIHSWRFHGDEAAIDTTFLQFKTYMNCGQLSKAYELMSPDYQATHSAEDLRKDYGFLFGEHGFWYVDPNRSIRIKGDRAELYPGDAIRDIPWSGPVYHFARVETSCVRVWRLTGTYDWSVD